MGPVGRCEIELLKNTPIHPERAPKKDDKITIIPSRSVHCRAAAAGARGGSGLPADRPGRWAGDECGGDYYWWLKNQRKDADDLIGAKNGLILTPENESSAHQII